MNDARPTCFHCGLPVAADSDFFAVVRGRKESMCCPGCAAVATAIDEAGLSDYYKHRTSNPRSQRELVPAALEQLKVYDNEKIQQSFVRSPGGSIRKAHLVLEGIECAACIWLNERHLNTLPGVLEASINYSTQQASVTWDDSVIHLSDILVSISSIGYLAHPYDPGRQQILLEARRRRLLKQIGVAAAFGMQVMILTVALYAGDWYGMEPEFQQFFRRFSLLLTLPVLIYSGRGFFSNAWTDLKLRRVSMDVPVSIGIALAFSASTWHVVTGEGSIYFESVCMFVLFLLTARYFELMSRMRAMVASESIGHIKPSSARRFIGANPGGDTETIPAAELGVGDLVRILPGEVVPADGTIISGKSGLDESLLSGESAPVTKSEGDTVIGGSINTESPLVVRVVGTGDDTVLAEIHRLLARAFSGKPRIARLADRVAAYFVTGVLTVTAFVAVFWFSRGDPDWLEITVSVLVVSCPCALSLAVPTALSSAIASLIGQKLLVTSEHAIETLSRVDVFVFDKTGTLTEGRPKLHTIQPLAQDAIDCLRVAAALESASEHPISRAVKDAAESRGLAPLPVIESLNRPGFGVSGIVGDHRYWLGNRTLIKSETSLVPPEASHPESGTEIYLADESRILCRFVLTDELRPDSAETIAALRGRGLSVALLSGDNQNVANDVARRLGMEEVIAQCSPAAKLDYVKRRQAGGDKVAMVGDGINDAPVLAGADVSISAGGASAIAVASADVVALSGDLLPVLTAYDTSVKTIRILRQNLGWAIGYNLLAIPAAASGLVTPWLAALGMSLSSLLVVANAARLRRPGDHARRSGP